MKSKSIIYMLFAFLCFTSYHANGSKINLPNIKSHDFTLSKFDGTPDVWVMVKEENGIKVYFSEFKEFGNSYLKIRFENLTNEPVQFNWSLSDKNSENLINDYTSKLESNSFIDFIHTAHLVLLKNGESLTDFSISLNIKKHS